MIIVIPSFALESGEVLYEVPVAYRTWGRLNEARDNALVVCHSLTSNPDLDAWWGPLLGPGRAFDTDRYFVICANLLGSCYGTAGPTTLNPQTGRPYGIDFPVPTIRDTVALHRVLLRRLGVKGVAAAIGASMGGMQVLEWAFYGAYVRALIPIAVGGRHSAWCIGWTEAQRQAIYADPCWQGGRYAPEAPPVAGLAAARMMAMLSYRARPSFEARFGREQMANGGPGRHLFAMESYLHHQGAKLVDRFDAASYVRLTQSMNTHDVARGRGAYEDVLRSIYQPTLVVGIDSDILYPIEEQQELTSYLPNADLAILESPDGHDAFLIEHTWMNNLLRRWLDATARVLLPTS